MWPKPHFCPVHKKLQSQWHCSGGFIVNFKHISHLSAVFVVEFEQVNVAWYCHKYYYKERFLSSGKKGRLLMWSRKFLYIFLFLLLYFWSWQEYSPALASVWVKSSRHGQIKKNVGYKESAISIKNLVRECRS